MSKVLLTSKTAWSSRLCALTWKERDTKSGRSIFQLQVSVLPTEEKESGLWLTPNATIRPTRSEEAMKHREEYRKSIGRTTVPPGSLAEQVQYGKPTTDMKIWRTPTTMDTKEDSLKHATKLVQGKNLRSTGSRIQITLADEVMVEEIINNPELMEKYKDYEMMTRKNLPEQQEFVDYMREQTSVKELHEKTGIKKTTVEHWFRRDKAGFSHPSIEDWNKIKPHLKTIKYDNVMTALHSIEWKEEMKMWRTPDAHCNRGPSSEKRMKMKLEKGMPISINDQVAHPNLMWPTPNARDWKDSINKVPPSVGKTRGHTLGMKVAEIRQQEQKMWPTPSRGMWKQDVNDNGEYAKRVKDKGHQVMLPAAVKLWPTPTQDSATERTKKYSQGGKPLTLAVKEAQMWPTPRAAIGMTMKLSQGMANLRHKKYLETESGISGESSWWHVEPDVGRVAHGIPGRVYRLKGLGNSIIPKIAEEIGKAIIKAEKE
jgi:hypothetical protein